MKKVLLAGLATGLLMVGMTAPANANLLTNGSFENPVVTGNGGTWQLYNNGSGYDIPGWDGQGQDIELQTSSLFGPAAEGNQYMELDSNTETGGDPWVVQWLSTTIGQKYEFKFAYSPRKGIADNTLEFGAGEYIPSLLFGSLNTSGVGQSGTSWTYYTYFFTANTLTTGVAFRNGGSNDSYGAFVDDVSVNPVPEPAAMLLFGTGIAGLAGIARRKRS